MTFFSYLRVELNRIFHSKTTWLIIILTICTPLAGYFFYQPATIETKASTWIANPTLTGAIGGSVLFALLTLFELDRVYKNDTAALTDTIASPLVMHVCRVLSVMATAVACAMMAILIYLPVTAMKMGGYFLPYDYFACWLILMLPALIFGVLAAAVFYQVFRRVDVGFVAFLAFALLSFSPYFADNYLLRWINPLAPILSDDFGNAIVFRTALYNRFFWLLLLGGLWIISLMFVRRYGKGFLGSFFKNIRRGWVLFLGLVIAAGSVYTFISQPYIDHSPIDPVFADVEYDENLIWRGAKANITLNEVSGSLSGKVVYTIDNTGDTSSECSMLINPGYTIWSVKLNGAEIDFTDLNNDTDNKKEILFTLSPGSGQEIAVEYGGAPQAWSFSRKFLTSKIISRDYVELHKAELFPVPQMLYDDATELVCRLTLADNLTAVVAVDFIEIESENGDGTNTWILKDIWSGRIDIYAAEYAVEIFEEAGMYIEFYYSKNHQEIFDKLGAMDTVRSVLNYCAEHYGALDCTKENPLKLVQFHALGFGGGAWDGMCVLSESVFSEEHLNDTALGAQGDEVLAHEIVHQWWGLSWMMYEEMYVERSEWTSEGLTCYTTYRLMKELYGEEYAQTYYVDIWEAEVNQMSRSFYYRHPEYLDILPEKYVVDIQGSQLSALRYCAMPLKLLKAAELLGGEDKLDEVLADLFENGGEELPEPMNEYFLTYNDFLNACGLTEEDLRLD